MRHCDVAIVGGGIVGLSTARALLERRPGLRVTVLEKEPDLARHQTGHNSGVIHSGVYYPPGSRKASYAVQGAAAMYRFCADHGLPARQTGKVIVATRDGELDRLAALERRAADNGVAARRLSAGELAEREPAVRAVAALLVPVTGVVDFAAVARRYAELARDGGADIRLCCRVAGAADDRPGRAGGAGITLEPESGEPVRASVLVNCAGLFSDRLARACGVQPPVRILPFRGEYFTLGPRVAPLVRHLVYPVPDPLFPFLGVHLTRGIGGEVHAGPNAVLALRREGYRPTDVLAGDLAEVARYRGFWRLAARNWRAALAEYSGSLSRRVYAGRVARMLPGIRAADLLPGPAGVRAQAVTPDGRLVDDFIVLESPRALHVLNAPSPAATASLPIGDHLADQALRRLP